MIWGLLAEIVAGFESYRNGTRYIIFRWPAYGMRLCVSQPMNHKNGTSRPHLK